MSAQTSEAIEELRAALTRRGNVKLLNLLLRAEGKLRRDSLVVARHPGFGRRVSYEPVSADGYYQDGSMRCPFEDIRGEMPCGWHTYSGCSDDFEAPAVAQ
jgi:hypothetical protein